MGDEGEANTPEPDDDELRARRETGKLLRDWRTQKGASQLEVARHLGVGQTFIVKLEKGEKPASMSHLRRIAAFYEMPVTDLLRTPEEVEADRARFDITSVKDPEVRALITDMFARFGDDKK